MPLSMFKPMALYRAGLVSEKEPAQETTSGALRGIVVVRVMGNNDHILWDKHTHTQQRVHHALNLTSLVFTVLSDFYSLIF